MRSYGLLFVSRAKLSNRCGLRAFSQKESFTPPLRLGGHMEAVGRRTGAPGPNFSDAGWRDGRCRTHNPPTPPRHPTTKRTHDATP